MQNAGGSNRGLTAVVPGAFLPSSSLVYFGMQKIAYLVGAWPVWSETFIQQELRLLLAQQLPLVPLAVAPGNGAAPPDLPAVPTLTVGPARGHSIACLVRGLVPGMFRRHLWGLRHAPATNELVRLCGEAGVGHIHAAFGGMPAVLAVTAAKRLGLSYSVSVHAADVFVGRHDDKYVFKNAAFVACCNHCVQEELRRRSPWLQDRLQLIHHGLCLDEWPFVERTRLQDPLQFLFVGRFVDKKDPLAAVRLVRRLAQAGTPVKLTMVGDGALRDEAAVEAVGFEAHFPGVLSRGEVESLMRLSDVLLVTSRELQSGDREGIPNVVLEAMATGLPVLAPATGSIPEVLNDETGWLIEPHDADGFQELIQRLCENPAPLWNRAAAARQLVENRFNAKDLVAARAELLRTAAEGRARQ